MAFSATSPETSQQFQVSRTFKTAGGEEGI
jgi:hypothetical protein